jgi:hypothetical protein
MEYIRATGKFEIKDVLSWSADKSKKEQTPFIELGLLVDCAGMDKVVRWVGYLSEKSAERTINAILDLGFKGNGPEDFVNGSQDLFQVPSGVTVTVVSEEYQGKTYYKGSFINKGVTKKEVGDIVNILNQAGFTKYKMRYNSKVETTAKPLSVEEIPF